MIDIIIPCYNAVNTIFRALASIYMQTIKDKIRVYIVNDCDGLNYSDIISKFDMSITYLERPVNGGAGLARQYGIDHSDSDYIMFLDADDCLASAFACELLLYEAQTNKSDLVFGAFDNDVRRNKRLFITETALSATWLHGKLYRRKFIEKNNIRFIEGLRTNEDVYFNQLLLSYSPLTHSVDKVCYSWIHTKGSITRQSDPDSRYNILYGYIEASEAYASEVIKRGLLDKILVIQRVTDGLLYNYWHYIELLDTYDKDHCIKFLCRCREYYSNALELIPEALDNELLSSQNHRILKRPEISVQIPTVTIPDFIKSIQSTV